MSSKDLGGIVSGLATRFSGSRNHDYLKDVASYSEKGNFEIDLLSGNASLPALHNELVFNESKHWVFTQLNKIGIDNREVEAIKIRISYKKIKSSSYFDCEAEIIVKREIFTAKTKSSFS